MDEENKIKSLQKYINELESKLLEKENSSTNFVVNFENIIEQNLLNNLPVGIILLEVIDKSNLSASKIQNVNDFFIKITSINKDDIQGKSILEVIDESKFPPNFLSDVFSNDQKISLKIPIKDSQKHFQLTIFKIDEKHLTFAFNDFTSLKEAQETIIFERNLFQTLLNKFPDSIYFKDKRARFLRASLHLTQLFHTTPNEIIGKTDYNFYGKELAEKKFSDDMNVIETGIPLINKIEKGTTPDGNERWLSTTKLPLFNRKGEIEGLFGISRDITDRKISEEKQDEYKKNLITLTESAINLLKLDTKKQIFDYISNTLEKHFKHSIIAYSINSQDKNLFFESSNNNADCQNTLNLLNKHKVFEHIINNENLNKLLFKGKLVSCNRDARSIFHHNDFKLFFEEKRIKHQYILTIIEKNEVIGIIFIMMKNGIQLQDKNFVNTFIQQSSLILHRKNLEELLIIEKERAEESDNLKSSFLANLSHEIRTPINAIQGFGELLKTDELPFEKKVEYIDIIQEKSNQLIQIITDIIDISKIESNQVKVVETTENLNVFLNEIVSDFEFRISNFLKKDIPLIFVNGLPDDNSTISTDFSLLKQVVSNLISNAIKFTHDGLIEIGYTISNNKLNFYVQDTGLGIPKEKREIVFDRFRQVDESRTRKYGGTGLGLTISKSILALIHGNIWIEASRPENFTNQEFLINSFNKIKDKAEFGARFNFTIPFKPFLPKTTAIEETNDYNWENKKILIIEDDSFNYHYINEVLEIYNPQISHCLNGKDGVDYFLKNQDSIDLILMDLQMPVMDGYEATKIIREHNKSVPIIVQTAFSMPDDIKKAKDAGSTDYIVKPYTTNGLIQKISKYL